MARPLVLIVEDDAAVARFIAAVVRLVGWRARVASNGRDGLRAAQRLHPDAVVLDLSLPVMGGLDVLRALKRDPATAPIPVLVLTGSPVGDEEGLARALGAADYLRKPIAAPALTDALRRVIAPEPPPSP
jgi:CheY-like chemotaxis protein